MLTSDGSLAQELAQFIADNDIQITAQPLGFDCQNGGILGTIGPAGSWFLPQPGTSQLVLAKEIFECGWTTTEAVTVMAHETEHMRQVFSGLFLDPTDLTILHLEDVEGPAYITETLVWDSLRRDSQGNIVLTTSNSDVDRRTNSFILPDGSVDVAAHNAYISQTRDIKPSCPFFAQASCP